jgi:hypothetical protein
VHTLSVVWREQRSVEDAGTLFIAGSSSDFHIS